MLLHWHTDARDDALPRRFADACLRRLYDTPRSPVTVLQTWEGPEGGAWPCVQYPLGPPRAHLTPEELAECAPDRTVHAVPVETLGVALYSGQEPGSAPAPEEAPSAWWAWSEAGAEALRRRWPGVPHRVFYPPVDFTAEGPVVASVGLDPLRIGFVLDPERPESWDRWRRLGEELRRRLPGITVQPLLDDRPYAPDWGDIDPPEGFRLRGLAAGRCGVLVFTAADPAWSGSVLQALREGRLVAGSGEASFASYLDEGRGETWNGDALAGDGWVRRLRTLLADPAERDGRTRRARAWARRWTLERAALELQALLGLRGAGAAAATRQPVSWLLRREHGVGDLVFLLSGAAALRRRDPGCRVAVHTARRYQEWVSWFPHLAEVTAGPFAPPWGVRVADFETMLPVDAPGDRSLAMASQLGVQPEEWTPAPEIPADLRVHARCRLGSSSRRRIAFVPASRERAVARSLPQGVADEVAAQLTELGEVVWLDETTRARPAPPGVRDLTGRLSLPEALAVLAECDLCVSVDTGLLYFAVAAGLPAAALFTHIGALQRLWLARRFVAVQPALPCAPCGETEHAFHCRPERAFGTEPLPCVTLLQPEVILSAVRRALELDGRRVREVAPGGTWIEWDPDRVPPPWPGHQLPVAHPGPPALSECRRENALVLSMSRPDSCPQSPGPGHLVDTDKGPSAGTATPLLSGEGPGVGSPENRWHSVRQ